MVLRVKTCFLFAVRLFRKNEQCDFLKMELKGSRRGYARVRVFIKRC